MPLESILGGDRGYRRGATIERDGIALSKTRNRAITEQRTSGTNAGTIFRTSKHFNITNASPMGVADYAKLYPLIHTCIVSCARAQVSFTQSHVTFPWQSAKTCDHPEVCPSHKDRSKISLAPACGARKALMQ